MKHPFKTFTLHKLDAHIADLYIAEYSDSLLLLDSGCKSDISIIESYTEKVLKRDMSDFKLLVVTHPHPDHAGSAMKLSSRHGIPIAAPENINSWYRGFRGLLQHSVDTILAHISARSRNMPFRSVSFPRLLEVDYPLADSSLLPFFPDWEIISAPGHTEFDIVLYNSKESLLYCSDTIVMIRDKYLSPYPVTDKIKMTATLKRIGELDIKTVAMAHGGITSTDSIRLLTSELIAALDIPLTGMLKLFLPLTHFPQPLKKK